MQDDIAPGARDDRLAELRSSAKGWHGIQLAALGFIGLCGVLQTGDASEPKLLQWLAGILVLVAFVLASTGIYLVGRAAWPLYDPQREPGQAADREALTLASSQLRRGLAMTFASIAAVALATATSWWPNTETAGSQVQVRATDGQSWCGRLADAPQQGSLRIETASEPVVVSLDTLSSVAPVDGC
jgi:hypothetical protein